MKDSKLKMVGMWKFYWGKVVVFIVVILVVMLLIYSLVCVLKEGIIGVE